MRRLFSTFAPGRPGAGLLLMRLVAGIGIVFHASLRLRSGFSIDGVPAFAAGILLISGLWTPIAGLLAALLAVWSTVSQPGDRWACIFLATIGAALALLGPGAWSLDARIFGWKCIRIRARKTQLRPL